MLRGPLQVLSAESIYDGFSNAIYSLSTGAKTWSISVAEGWSAAAVAGSSVTFVSGNQLLVEPY